MHLYVKKSKPEYSIHRVIFLFFSSDALKNNKIKKLDDWNLIWLHVRMKYNLSPVRDLTFLWNRTHRLLHADVHHYRLRESKTKPSISLSASITVCSPDRWTATPVAFPHGSSHSTDLWKKVHEKVHVCWLMSFWQMWLIQECQKVKLMAGAFHNAHRTSWKPALV